MENLKEYTVGADDIRQMKKDISDFGQKLDTIYYALVGNELAQDGGLIRRVADLEMQKAALAERVDILEKAALKASVRLHIIWGLGGAILAIVFSVIVDHVLKK